MNTQSTPVMPLNVQRAFERLELNKFILGLLVQRNELFEALQAMVEQYATIGPALYPELNLPESEIIKMARAVLAKCNQTN